jgi:hypothetical protein
MCQNLSTRETEIIHTEAYDLLKDYENTLNKIAENSRTNEAEVTKMKNHFITLFLNRQIFVFNDLEPGHQYSEFYDAETYISNLVLWYPDGMHVNYNWKNIKTPGIKHHRDNIWFVDLITEKTINGNYMNRTLNNNKEEHAIRIAFIKNGRKVYNFRIVGIRSTKSATLLTDEKALKELNKADYTEDDLIQVHASVKSLLMDYNRALEFIGNPEEKAEYKKMFVMDFLSLFASEVTKVYNDIEPKPENELIEINKYVENYQTDYPKGISNLTLNIDSATFSHIETTDDQEKFRTYVYVDKFFSGDYKDKQKFSSAGKIIFTVSVERKEDVFQNLVIESIDKEYTDFSGINTQTEEISDVNKPLKPITRLGNSIGVSYMGGISNINSKNINELSQEHDNHTWTITRSYGYSAGIDFIVFRNENYGICSGLKYFGFETGYRLSGEFRNPESTYDPNNKMHVDSVIANMDSVVSLKYLGVPIGVKYIYDLNKKIALFANAGLNLAFLYSSEYELSGRYHNYGYYESNEDALQVISEPELGFRKDIYDPPQTGKPNIKSVNLTGELSLGLIIKTGYYSAVQLGPKIIFGLSSITDASVYKDIFSRQHELKPTRTNNIGFEISYIRKL